VKLTGGKLGLKRVVSRDPLEVARHWAREGARWIHVVDLDAAFGDGSSWPIVRRLLREPLRFQVSGGMKTEAQIERALAAGAERVIVGTRAVTDPDWLARAAERFRRRLWVAVDSRGSEVVAHGWTRSAGDLARLVARLDPLPFGGFLFTNVSVEGRRRGIDRRAVRRVLNLTSKPVCYSGGVSTLADVRALRRLGTFAIIVGAALYFGGFAYADAAKEAR
jgi:phosphoribosylformimino-5-aminoimidazole carboxamide ribotide isomerase